MTVLKIRKILAYYLDWGIICGGAIALANFVSPFVFKLSRIIIYLSSIVLFIAIYSLFTRRDILCKGRSIGKRIFLLIVCDEEGNELVDTNLLKKRGRIEIFTFPIDFIVILFKGKQIADYVCKTEVRDYKNGEN